MRLTPEVILTKNRSKFTHGFVFYKPTDLMIAMWIRAPLRNRD
jgi:hypothetical protein